MYEKDLQIEDNNPQWIKFVDYFNEFWKEKFGERSPFEYESRFDNVHIISKHMGFIEWLVKNNKINKDLVSRVLIRAYVSPKTMVSLECEFYDYYESLLMLLAIQNDPITFILKILK